MRVKNFEKLVLTERGSMAFVTEYEVAFTGKAVEVKHFEGAWEFRPDITRDDCLVSGAVCTPEKMLEVLNKNHVGDRDGFYKTNPNVLDGFSFSFDGEINGKRVYARGTNSVPKGYYEFKSDLYLIAEGEEA